MESVFCAADVAFVCHVEVFCDSQKIKDTPPLSFQTGLGYGMDGPGQEIFLFSKMSRPRLGPTQPHVQRLPKYYPSGKAAGDVKLTNDPHLKSR